MFTETYFTTIGLTLGVYLLIYSRRSIIMARRFSEQITSAYYKEVDPIIRVFDLASET